MQIKRTVFDWGVRLISRPIATDLDMYIQVDISKRPKQGVDVRYFFSGTTVQTPLRSGDVRLWVAALQEINEAAKKEAS